MNSETNTAENIKENNKNLRIITINKFHKVSGSWKMHNQGQFIYFIYTVKKYQI